MVSQNGQNGSHKPSDGRKVTGKTLFPIRAVFGTPGAVKIMELHGLHPLVLAAMHHSGLWGDVPPEDARENERALKTGDRIMSVYRFGPDTLWVITDPGHETTTILTPAEY